MQSTSDFIQTICSVFTIVIALLYGVGLYVPTLRKKLYRSQDQREQSPSQQRIWTQRQTLLLLALLFLGSSLLLSSLDSVLAISTVRKEEISSTLILLSGICLLAVLLIDGYTFIQRRRRSQE